MQNKIIIIIIFIIQFFYSLYSENINIYFLNPDIGYQASVLVNEADKYFNKQAKGFLFQPIVKPKYIKKLFLQKQVHFMIVSPILKESLKRTMSAQIDVLNVPILDNNSCEYQKVYISKKKEKISVLKNRTIAIASYGEINKELAKDYYFNNPGLKLGDVNIIWVKKDLDAIFGVILGQVDAAIVSPVVLNNMWKTSPSLAENIYSIGKTKPLPAPYLFVVSYNGKQENIKEMVKQIKNIFEEMHVSTEGQNLLEVLWMKKWVGKNK